VKLVLTGLLVAVQAIAQGGAIKGQVDPLSAGQNYLLGSGDQVTIRATNTDEIGDKPFRIESDGTINVPLLGPVRASGKTVEQLESLLREGLRKYVRDPQVIVTVQQFRTETVTFSGAFKSPGVYNLTGRHTLTEMLAVVGGLDTNASRLLRIGRQTAQGELGLPNERTEADGTTYVGTVDVSAIPGQRNAGDDVVLKPFDVVQAVQQDPIYVSGAVGKIGPIALGDRKTLGLFQALNLAGGLTNEASNRIKIYRPIADSSQKREIQVALDRVLKGLQPDVFLMPRDVVVVPRSASKAFMAKAAGVGVGVLTGLLVTAH
jgi:polysaccharide export outer membrane protein